MPSPLPLPSKAARLILFALLTVLWFSDLGTRRLIHPDEGRYAEIAREMYVTGDWVTPRVNGLKYFEKPPLQYWATAAAYRLFGVGEWTARVWPALAGWLAVIAIGYAGFALGGAVLGTFAALALAGMLWHVAIAQLVTLDSGLAFFLTLGFAALVTAQRPAATDRQRRVWMWLAWAALAGATLSKGLIGVVLPGGALVLYSVLTRDFAVWRRMSLVSGVILFLALTAPWFVAVSWRNDEFARFFFIHEHFERYLTTEHMRVEPWYYFIPIALIGSLPWVTVLVCGTWRAWREGAPNALGFSWQRFALAWAAFVLLFFSASGSKLASYILPMFGPLALVVGWLLVRLDARLLFRLTLPIAIGAAVAAVALFIG
ncbi:MAG TPA: glycosyltransferase family 39 protein, partial [Casimicrobiaceae bacterium]|nr:glycosyltransferase family 39 protein [Casimicrobiaceae bacterium]